jgi:hypothetical protein
MGTQSHDFVEAERIVAALHQAGKLDEAKVREFATTGKIDEATVALSILCDLPIDTCQRAMMQSRVEPVLLLAWAIGLSWITTKTLLLLRADSGAVSSAEIEEGLASFNKLQPEAARKGLQILRLRQRPSVFNPGPLAYR